VERPEGRAGKDFHQDKLPVVGMIRSGRWVGRMAPRRRQDERARFRAGSDAPRRDGDDACESGHSDACGQD